MNSHQKPKTTLGKYKINEIAYSSNENYRVVASRFGILICDAKTGEEHHLLPSPKNEVLSVAYSPDGNIIASGKADNTIQLWRGWNSYRGSHDKHILKGHTGSVTSVVFSPDGKILASGSKDGTIRLWEVVCEESREYRSREQGLVSISHQSTLEHSGVTSVVFSPDGKILASGSKDGTIRLWESETRFGKNRCITTLDEPKIDVYPTIFIDNNSQKAVTSVVFSPNDSILASGYSDGTIYLWDIRTLIPFVKRDSDEDRLFWYTNRDLSKNRIALEKKHTDSIQSLDFSSDGRTLASGSKNKTICIWDSKASQHLATLKKHTDTVFSVVFQDKQLVSESSDGSIRFWNTETGENEETLVGGYIGNIESVVLSPDGQVLAGIGKRGWRNTIINFWDVNTREIKSTITTEVEDFGSVYFSPNSQTFIGIGRSDDNQRYTNEKTIHFWDVNTGEIKKKMKNPGTDRFSPDGRILIDNSGILWDVNTGEQKASIREKIETFKSVHFSPNSKVLVTIENKKEVDPDGYSRSKRISGVNIHFWDVDTGERKRSITEKTESLKSIRFSSDSKTLVTIGTEKKTDSHGYSRSEQISGVNIHFWDIDTGERKRSITEKIEIFESIRFSSDSKTLVIIGTEKKTDSHGYSRSEQSSRANMHLWDVDTGKRKHSITEKIETFKSVQFSPDSKTLAIVGTEKKTDSHGYSRSERISGINIHFWDVETGEQRASITEKIETFESVQFSPDSKTLVGVTASKIYFWDIETGKHRKTTLAKKGFNVESIAFSRDSRLLLSVSTNEDEDHNETQESKIRTFCFCDVETEEPISTHLEEMTNNIQSVIFSSDKTKFVSVHSDNLIRLWDVDTGKHQSTFEGPQEDIASVAFSLDNRHLACGSRNGMILLWEITK